MSKAFKTINLHYTLTYNLYKDAVHIHSSEVVRQVIFQLAPTWHAIILKLTVFAP